MKVEDHSSTQTSSCNRPIINTLSVIMGSGAGIPYVVPAYETAGEYHALGYFFAAGTVIVFAIDSVWGWNDILTTINEKRQNNVQFLIRSNIFKLGGALVLASCSGGMSFYLVNRYNDSILFPILTLICNFGLDCSGYYRLISFLSSLNKKDLLLLKQHICNHDVLKKIALIFPMGSLVVNTYLSYLAGYNAVSNSYVAIPYSLITSLSSFALEVYSSQSLLQQVCNKEKQNTEDDTQKKNVQNYFKILCKILTCPLVVMSLSSRVFITLDNFGKNVVGYILASLSAGSGFMFGQYVATGFVNKSFSFFSDARNTNQTEKISYDSEYDEITSEYIPLNLAAN